MDKKCYVVKEYTKKTNNKKHGVRKHTRCGKSAKDVQLKELEDSGDLGEIRDFLQANENTFRQKLTKNGSEYIDVNGILFRKADHDQPSWWTQHYKSIKSYKEIIPHLRKIKYLRTIPISRYEFIKLYVDGGVYEGKKILKKGGYYDNGSSGRFSEIESSANNLFAQIFVLDNLGENIDFTDLYK